MSVVDPIEEIENKAAEDIKAHEEAQKLREQQERELIAAMRLAKNSVYGGAHEDKLVKYWGGGSLKSRLNEATRDKLWKTGWDDDFDDNSWGGWKF